MRLVSFVTFIELLCEVAMQDNPTIRNKDYAIEHFLRDKVLKKGIIMDNTQKLKYEQWFEEIDGFDVKEFMESKKAYLTNV